MELEILWCFHGEFLKPKNSEDFLNSEESSNNARVKTITDNFYFQVLDLYQNPKNKTEVPDSPPQLPPSKASPPMKRARLQQSPIAPQKTATNHIPVKVCILDDFVHLKVLIDKKFSLPGVE